MSLVLLQILQGEDMVKSRREVGEDVEAGATDSEKQSFSTSSCVGEGSYGDSSETDSSEGVFKSYGVACYYEPQWVGDDFLSEELGELEHINMSCNFDLTYFLVIKAAFQIPRLMRRGCRKWVR